MKQLRLLVLAMLALFAFGAVSAAVASAEVELEAKPPALLVLDKEKVEELTYKGSSAVASKIEGSKTKKTIECGAVEANIAAKGLKPLSAIRIADTAKGEATIDFTKCKQGGVACRSETTAGVKDAIETLLVLVDIEFGTEETAKKELQAIIIVTVLGEDNKPVLFINCGGVKDEIKGNFILLIEPPLKELEAGTAVTIKSEQKEGKPVTGTCLEPVAGCERVTKEPLTANLGGGVETAGEQFSISGTFNKMVFLDD